MTSSSPTGYGGGGHSGGGGGYGGGGKMSFNLPFKSNTNKTVR